MIAGGFDYFRLADDSPVIASMRNRLAITRCRIESYLKACYQHL